MVSFTSFDLPLSAYSTSTRIHDRGIAPSSSLVSTERLPHRHHRSGLHLHGTRIADFIVCASLTVWGISARGIRDGSSCKDCSPLERYQTSFRLTTLAPWSSYETPYHCRQRLLTNATRVAWKLRLTGTARYDGPRAVGRLERRMPRQVADLSFAHYTSLQHLKPP